MFGLPSREVGIGSFDVLSDPAAAKTGLSTRAAPAFRGEVVEYRGQVTNPEDVTPHWPTTPEPRVVDELFFPVRDALGHVHQVVAILRDDTAGHAARQRLALSERLATVGTLAAGVAHEINNPMSYVAANVSWLQREFESQPEALSDLTRAAVFEALREAEDGVARVQAIVRDLATFSRGSPGATTTVRLTEVIEPILRLLTHETRPRATVVQRVPATLTVRADPLTLGHVVLNLVQNAAQAIEPGQPSAQSIDVSAAPLPDGMIRLTVADSGRGIGPDIAERIFDPFFTTKPVGQGMGLGLSISRNIVASLGGRLTFAPRPGGGTLFHVDLPASGGDSGPGPARPA